MKKLMFVIVFVLFVAGCATPPKDAVLISRMTDLRTIQQKHKDRISKIQLGMHKDDLATIFPEAYVKEQNGAWTAYEFADTEKYVTQGDILRQNLIWGFGSPRAHEGKRFLWFYFYKDLLLKWGKTDDWPKGTEAEWIKTHDEYTNAHAK